MDNESKVIIRSLEIMPMADYEYLRNKIDIISEKVSELPLLIKEVGRINKCLEGNGKIGLLQEVEDNASMIGGVNDKLVSHINELGVVKEERRKVNLLAKANRGKLVLLVLGYVLLFLKDWLLDLIGV